MSIRTTSFVEGEYYHIYNRGNSKRIIFQDKEDYFYFIRLLHAMNDSERKTVRNLKDRQNEENNEPLVAIGSYCLMPNHFHILLTQVAEGGITKFMQKLSTAYVMYFNKKYQHSGSLFEGKFKAKHVAGDTYLKYLFSYVHLNPLKIIDSEWKSKAKYLPKEMFDFLKSYKYSSFQEYFNNEFTVIKKHQFPDYFLTKEAFVNDLIYWFDKDQNIK
jgi:putative transposase